MSITDNGVAVRHSSETVEHYTPPHIVEAARATLGAIDLDPFSCVAANLTVRAAKIFANVGGCDGFAMPWEGRVFVNPPGGKTAGESNQKRVWFKLAHERWIGRVEAGIFVCFSVEMLQTTQVKTPANLPIPLDFPICYPSRRVAYVRADGQVGDSPPHSSCIILLPPMLEGAGAVERFRAAFSPIGRVVVPR